MNVQQNVIHREVPTDGTAVKYHVLGLDDWDYFDTLIKFFKKYYGAEPNNQTDGINTRMCQLRCENEYFILEHNEDIGNCFYSCEQGGDSSLMHEFSSDLEKRLNNIPYE
jgi:hypothetical protein